MALTEDQEKALLAAVAKIPDIAAKVDQMPGWISRVEGDVKTLRETKPPEKKEEPPPEKKDPTVSTLQAEIDAMKKQGFEKDKKLAINAAFASAGVEFLDTEYVTEKLGSLLVQDGDKFVVKTKEKLELTGAEVEKILTPAEAIQRFAKERPGLVKVKVKEGAGANAGNSEPVTENATYADLMKPQNARKLMEFQGKYPQKWAALQQEGIASLSKKK